MEPGIHLFHKPPGVTSFSVVQQCRALTARGSSKPPAICHGGTLDPFASGLLLLLVEPATQLFDYLHDIPKTYEATIRWGVETDNLDPTGRIVRTADASHLSPSQLQQAVQSFVGWHSQVPPPTSAKRIDGERAYEKAHRGEAVKLPPEQVYLHEVACLEHQLPERSRLRLTVAGGFYVRSFARDLALHVGSAGHLETLHRSSIGPWNDPGDSESVAIHGADLLPWLPIRHLTDQEVGMLRNHQPIALGTLAVPDWEIPNGFPSSDQLVRAFHLGRFRALLKHGDAGLQRATMLRGAL